MIYLSELKDTPWSPPVPQPPPEPQSIVSIVTQHHAPIIYTHTDFYWQMTMIPLAFVLILVAVIIKICRWQGWGGK